MIQAPLEIPILHPAEWHDEYRLTGSVAEWWEKSPDLFASYTSVPPNLSTRLGTLDLFAQYSLMYLLQQQEGFSSLTCYTIASTTNPSTRTGIFMSNCFALMSEYIGADQISQLRQALLDANLRNGKGEPDLFCWDPTTRAWFFAEAKGRDRLLPQQLEWHRVCREVIPDIDIRVYRVAPRALAA